MYLIPKFGSCLELRCGMGQLRKGSCQAQWTLSAVWGSTWGARAKDTQVPIGNFMRTTNTLYLCVLPVPASRGKIMKTAFTLTAWLISICLPTLATIPLQYLLMLFSWPSFSHTHTHTQMMPTGAGGVGVNVFSGMMHAVCSWKWPLAQETMEGAVCLGRNQRLTGLAPSPRVWNREFKERYNHGYDKRWKYLNFFQRLLNLHWLVRIRKDVRDLYWLGLWDTPRLKLVWARR